MTGLDPDRLAEVMQSHVEQDRVGGVAWLLAVALAERDLGGGPPEPQVPPPPDEWSSTVRPDGRPHVTPLTAVWCWEG